MCSDQSEKPVETKCIENQCFFETRKFIGIAIGNRLPEN